ncbi:hypothetical protein GLOIN_2v1772571 [Rhizophagus irregularis DAOM 181602=DAOM 197198]|nr:hypothetical protein GLOIN_2v1772571 [Rhizophagus irregularis DAOM 181602=DAOM 197198]
MELIRSLTEEEIEESQLKQQILSQGHENSRKTWETGMGSALGTREAELNPDNIISTNPQSLDVTPAISEEAVVDNINQWRQAVKTVTEHAQLRVNELKQIFKDCRRDMEWELIKKETCEEAESHGVIQKFTTLNDEFTERIKEENREIDEKNISVERATKSKMEKNIKRDGDKVRYVVGNGTTTLSVWGNGFGMEGGNGITKLKIYIIDFVCSKHSILITLKQ